MTPATVGPGPGPVSRWAPGGTQVIVRTPVASTPTPGGTHGWTARRQGRDRDRGRRGHRARARPAVRGRGRGGPRERRRPSHRCRRSRGRGRDRGGRRDRGGGRQLGDLGRRRLDRPARDRRVRPPRHRREQRHRGAQRRPLARHRGGLGPGPRREPQGVLRDDPRSGPAPLRSGFGGDRQHELGVGVRASVGHRVRVGEGRCGGPDPDRRP